MMEKHLTDYTGGYDKEEAHCPLKVGGGFLVYPFKTLVHFHPKPIVQIMHLGPKPIVQIVHLGPKLLV